MAIKKVKLPDNSVQDINDIRITGVDSSPTSGSGNVVTSGGVYTAISGLPTIYTGTTAPESSLGNDGDLYVQTAEVPTFVLTGTGTQSDPIVGWHENVAVVVNPEAHSEGLLSATIPGIYNYILNTVMPAVGSDFVAFDIGDGTIDQASIGVIFFMTGDNIGATYSEGYQPFLLNTDTYQRSSDKTKTRLLIYPSDLVEFNIKVD